MKTSQLIINLFVIAVLAVLFSQLSGIYPTIIFAVLIVAGAVKHIIKRKNGVCLFDGLAPEVWIPLVLQDPYPANSFLNGATDMSPQVDNDAINLAEAGADPDVLVENTTYPIPAAVAADVPKRVVLKTYDTTSTIVRNAIAIELAYDQRSLYADKHKKALMKKIGLDAAYLYAPSAADSTKSNVILNLGATDSIIDAVIDLQKAYNDVDDDGSGRNLVFCPAHMAAISKEDKKLYKAIMAEPGAIFYGFRVWTYSKNPIYVGATGVKAAQGAAFVNGTHKLASFSFLKSETMKAIGTVDFFSKLKDPDQKGDVFNFQMRALAQQLRNKYQGAILQ